MPSDTRLAFRPLGGPTALLEIGAARLLTDPTFDSPRSYESASGARLTKVTGPALPAGEVGRIDAVLLSHDHHFDNFDAAGRELARSVPVVVTTASGAERIGGGATGLAEWQSIEVDGGDGRTLSITAVPAQHGPSDSAHLMGDVIGFVVEARGVPTIYVSGDNASVEVVRDIGERFPAIDVAVLFAGGARTPTLGDAYLTLSNEMAVDAARVLGARAVLPVHTDGWAHFSDDGPSLRRAFEASGLGEVLVMPPPGERAVLDLQP